ncbi:MAG: NAD kinase [Flavobacteriales bacterium]|nr:NAD kinase [Flavobacteriales bacterium]
MTIGIYGTEFKDEFNDGIKDLIESLLDRSVNVKVYSPFKAHLLSKMSFNIDLPEFSDHYQVKEELDLLFSIGGDGTFLSTISLIRDSGIPILGINTGRLGFLSTVAVPGIEESLDLVLTGRYAIQERGLVTLDIDDNPFGEVNYALNEIAIIKRDSSSMIVIHCEVDDEYLHSYWADGLLIATPTGSTAYSLSCSGPIVHPETNSLIINPIAPHHLNVRPMIVPDDVCLKLKADGRDDQFLITLDSRSAVIRSDQELIIKKAPFKINLVIPEGHTFLSTMKNKLLWGMDKRN